MIYSFREMGLEAALGRGRGREWRPRVSDNSTREGPRGPRKGRAGLCALVWSQEPA